MGSSSPGTTPNYIRNFESLIPQCFYSYVFLFARLFLIMSLPVMAGIVGSLLNNMTKAGEPVATSVVAIMIVTSASLLWCLSSWSGYSRRHFPYKVTIVTDVLFLIPFGVFSVLLGLPMHDGGTMCPQVSPNNAFTIRTGPLGAIDFSGERTGRVACAKLYLLWVLLLVVCACFVLSAGSVGVIHSQATKISRALWSARAMGDPMGGSDYRRSPSEITVARLREAFHGFERQLHEEPRVHVSTRSLDSGEAANEDDDNHDDDDRRGGGGEVYYQNKDPYRINTTNRSGPPPRASRYDCTPRVESSLGYRDEYGASSSSSQERSLGNNAMLQAQGEGNGPLINNYNRSWGRGGAGGGGAWTSSSREGATESRVEHNLNQNRQEQVNRAGGPGLANNRELSTTNLKPPGAPKPIPLPVRVLQARNAALDQLEGRSSGSSNDLADAPYLRDLYHTFMYPQALPNPDPDHDPDIDRDSWATFTNANRYNPRGQTQGKQQRPSGLLFLPNSNIASSPTLGPVPDPDPYPYPYPHTTRAVESNPSSYDTTTTSDRLTQAQAQTQIHGSHDSYSSSFYSTPSLYDDNNNTRVRFDYRDLPSPLSPPPLLPRSSSSGAGGLKYSLPPRPRTTLRVVDEETLNRLEGISEEGFLSGSGNGIGSGSGNWTGIGISDRGGSGSRSGNGIGDGGDNREEEDVELDEIPISPLPPAPAWLGRPSDRVIGEPEGYGYTEGPTRVQTEGQQQQEQEWRYGGWGREQEQQHGQEVRETRSTGKKNGRTRVTRWPGMWGIGSGSGSGSGYVGHKEKDMDGQCTSSRHRHGGFRARSTRLFSTIGAWLNGIDNGGRNDGTRHQRDGYGFRSRNGSGGHPWDSQQWDMV